MREKYKEAKFKIIDEIVKPLSDQILFGELKDTEESIIVGISCLTATFSRAIELAKKIKYFRPEALVVFGGVHPTACPQECLETGVVDIVVRNEGEITMCEIYNTVREGNTFNDIKGISYVCKGKIYHNQNREYTNLNILPPFPYDLFENDLKTYSDFAFILSSRGCPFDCIFCSNRLITGQNYRTFSVDYIISQIDTLINKYHQKSISFGDDNLVSNKKHFFNLADSIFLKKFHERAFFSGQVRGDDMTSEILESMKRINFRLISCGIETSSERLLALVNKKETIEKIVKGIKLAKTKNIMTSATFIFGLPTETRAERMNSMQLALNLPLDTARFNIAIPYPGTKLFEMAKAEKRLQISPEWKNFNVQYYIFGDDIPYVPDTTKKYSLIFDTMWANLRFYLRFKILMTLFLKKTDMTGGNVISLQNRRNKFSFYVISVMLTLFIIKRFIIVAFKALKEKILCYS